MPLAHSKDTAPVPFERAENARAVRERVAAWRAAGERIAFVPTMGNLHAGHLSLIELAREHADRIAVSIFVNPTQFGPSEDIDSYPRTPDEDEALLSEQALTDLLFVPGVADVYPRGTADSVGVMLPALATELCGRSRPGHFNGVASVVLRLLNIVTPDVLVVGRKDYQQMVLLARMIDDLQIGVELVAGDIVREADGLAMSSRNSYLTKAERRSAPALNAALKALAASLRAGNADYEARRKETLAALAEAGFESEYLELRDARELAAVKADDTTRERVLLAAAWLGRARLIDNVLV